MINPFPIRMTMANNEENTATAMLVVDPYSLPSTDRFCEQEVVASSVDENMELVVVSFMAEKGNGLFPKSAAPNVDHGNVSSHYYTI